MYLLDTNVISELRKVRHGRTDPNFIAWSKTLRWADLYLSVITLYELEMGLSSLEAYDATQARILRVWFKDQILEKFRGRILPIDTEISILSGKLQAAQKRTVEDTLIAATAQIHRMKVVTRNIRHFEDTGVEIVNPWQP